MKRLAAGILIGLAVLASAWAVSRLARKTSTGVSSDPAVGQTTRPQDADDPAALVLASDDGPDRSDQPHLDVGGKGSPLHGQAAPIPQPIGSTPSPVVSNAVDGALFGPTLYERPPVDSADQRRMLADMLWRFDAADRLLLGVADAARDRARLLLLLRRLASGKSIPADVFQSMVRQLDQREQVVMERLARQYQLYVSRVFRRDSQQRTDRLEAWDDVLESWRRAGSPRTQRHELNAWLLAAIENSTPGTTAAAPTTPRFTFVPDLSSSAVARPVADSTDQQGPTAPAARPARLAIGPQLASSAFLGVRSGVSGLATLLDRRARRTPYGDAWGEGPRVGRVWPAPYQRREGDGLSLDQPNVDQRQVVSRPDPTAQTALPDRQVGWPIVSVYTPYSGLLRRASRVSLPARCWAESPWAAFAAAVDRLATPVSHARPLAIDDWSEPLVEPRTPPGPAAPELLAGNAAPSREPRPPAAKPVHFARFTAPLETNSARPIARLTRRANSRTSWVGRRPARSPAESRSETLGVALGGLRLAGIGLLAQESSAIPKVASSERARAVVATAAVPARQQHELEINLPRRPLAWRRSEAAPAAAPARRRRPSSRSAELASRPGAGHQLAERAAVRGTMARGPDLPSFAALASGPTSGSPVVLNRDEVAARIAGVNLALRAMAAELDQARTWNATQLAPVVQRLQDLWVRHGDLTLYLQLMEEHERDLVGRLESPRSIVTRLGTRIYQARRGVLDGEFRGGARTREVELEALDVLSRWLVKLTIQ